MLVRIVTAETSNPRDESRRDSRRSNHRCRRHRSGAYGRGSRPPGDVPRARAGRPRASDSHRRPGRPSPPIPRSPLQRVVRRVAGSSPHPEPPLGTRRRFPASFPRTSPSRRRRMERGRQRSRTRSRDRAASRRSPTRVGAPPEPPHTANRSHARFSKTRPTSATTSTMRHPGHRPVLPYPGRSITSNSNPADRAAWPTEVTANASREFRTGTRSAAPRPGCRGSTRSAWRPRPHGRRQRSACRQCLSPTRCRRRRSAGDRATRHSRSNSGSNSPAGAAGGTAARPAGCHCVHGGRVARSARTAARACIAAVASAIPRSRCWEDWARLVRASAGAANGLTACKGLNSR